LYFATHHHIDAQTRRARHAKAASKERSETTVRV
jgi:hypothetical protein